METTVETPQCWKDVADALACGVDRLILFGPPGTGKTFGGMSLGVPTSTDRFGVESRHAFRVICSEDMTTASVTGHMIPDASGSFSWNDGPMVDAWRVGGRAVLDEIDKASGDVLSELLAMTDSPESASWTNPITKEVVRPRDGFSVVMTTNLERMGDLPTALRDRFPIAIRIDRPHPKALERLSEDLRAFASASADADPGRRFSLRAFFEFDRVRGHLGAEHSARLVFGDQASTVLDALTIAGLDS
jgi:MoxR-like ATPase